MDRRIFDVLGGLASLSAEIALLLHSTVMRMASLTAYVPCTDGHIPGRSPTFQCLLFQ